MNCCFLSAAFKIDSGNESSFSIVVKVLGGMSNPSYIYNAIHHLQGQHNGKALVLHSKCKGS